MNELCIDLKTSDVESSVNDSFYFCIIDLILNLSLSYLTNKIVCLSNYIELRNYS